MDLPYRSRDARSGGAYGDEPALGYVTPCGPRQAQLAGFDLHANVCVPARARRPGSSASSSFTFLLEKRVTGRLSRARTVTSTNYRGGHPDQCE